MFHRKTGVPGVTRTRTVGLEDRNSIQLSYGDLFLNTLQKIIGVVKPINYFWFQFFPISILLIKFTKSCFYLKNTIFWGWKFENIYIDHIISPLKNYILYIPEIYDDVNKNMKSFKFFKLLNNNKTDQ